MPAELLEASGLWIAAAAARKCYGRHARSTPDKGLTPEDLSLLRRIILESDPAHDSVIEHIKYTWDVTTISRACSHQLVRHRIASYSQRSQRYVKEQGFEVVVPPSIQGNFQAVAVFNDVMRKISESYNFLIELGIPKQDARFVLPNACATTLIVTFNARSMRNFLKLRLDKRAQWEIRQLGWDMYNSLPENHKFLYEKETVS